jgi:predicted amidohydrolase
VEQTSVSGPRPGTSSKLPLSVAVAQPRCASHDVATNTIAHAALVRSAGSRVVVFPELSLTGYELGAAVISLDDPRLTPLADACAEAGSMALVGAPVEDEQRNVYIAMLAIDGYGVWVAYQKIWLGQVEAERFTPGPSPAVIAIDGWRLGLAICKDTGNAVHAAATAALGMDAYIAGMVESADDSTLPIQRARRIAVDHGVWVAIASFAGSTGGGFEHTAGHSVICSPVGEIVAELEDRPDEVARATLRGWPGALTAARPSRLPPRESCR